MRKRREDRWERNVLELGELLTTQVRRLGQEARSAQSMLRFLKGLQEISDIDQGKLAQELREQEIKTRQATNEFHDLVNTRVDWLVDRIQSSSTPAPRIISEFSAAARTYWLRTAVIRHWSDDDPRTEGAFEEEWTHESEALRTLLQAVKQIADLPYPPRARRDEAAKGWPDLLGGPNPGEGAR